MSLPIVHVVDDDEMVRSAVGRLLRTEGFEVRSHGSAGDFLLAVTGPGPGCAVLDLEMPGPSGLELQQALERWIPPPPVVFLTGRGDVPSSVKAMKAGAVDFLTKPVEPQALVAAVRAALARDAAAREAWQRRRDAEVRFASLTPRERAVFERVAAGMLNKEIAWELGITERTVKMHRGQVMAKTEAGSVADLVRIADALGIAPAGKDRKPDNAR